MYHIPITNYNKSVIELLEKEIEENIVHMLPKEKLLQREFWYVIVFCNCPYISLGTKNLLLSTLAEVTPSALNDTSDMAKKLVCDFLNLGNENLFFYWGYYKFDTSKQLTYRTYQRTLFKQYKRKNRYELYGSLDS